MLRAATLASASVTAIHASRSRLLRNGTVEAARLAGSLVAASSIWNLASATSRIRRLRSF
jgi:hypothetical protein